MNKGLQEQEAGETLQVRGTGGWVSEKAGWKSKPLAQVCRRNQSAPFGHVFATLSQQHSPGELRGGDREAMVQRPAREKRYYPSSLRKE